MPVDDSFWFGPTICPLPPCYERNCSAGECLPATHQASPDIHGRDAYSDPFLADWKIGVNFIAFHGYMLAAARQPKAAMGTSTHPLQDKATLPCSQLPLPTGKLRHHIRR